MLRLIPVVLMLLTSEYNVPERNKDNKQSLIFGSNSIQKIYYSTSSNYSINHDGKKAMDTDRESCWMSNPGVGPHWIEIDFGSKRIMSRIVVYPGRKDNYRTIRKLHIQFMYMEKWFDYAKINLVKKKESFLSKFGYNSSSYLDRVEVDLGGIDASTFRVYIPKGETFNGYAAIAEIETYVGNTKIKYYDERLLGICYPVKNGFLPENDSSYPNSPRAYRGGVHVGLDIYHHHEDDSYKPVPVNKSTPILAADGGVIIRADLDYKPLAVDEWKNQSAFYQKNPRTFVKRSFGGRQVWIDHGNGVVTTYNHMSKIADGLKKGSKVSKGEKIGYVGNSGLMGEAEGKDYGVHLHFEIWIDGHYLGYGMKVEDVRKYFSWIFAVHH